MNEPLGMLIGTYKVRESGKRGAQITLPQSWLDDEHVEWGDLVEERRHGEYLVLRHVKRQRYEP
jgi:hypothetical protein